MSFECGRLKELAEMFPDLAGHLSKISESLVDFIEPFNKYQYLVKEMEGKTTIKKVAHALNPGDDSLDYSNLPGVKKGNEAMDMFLKLRDMDPEERDTVREGMLEYCKLDTLSMVRIYEALLDAVDD